LHFDRMTTNPLGKPKPDKAQISLFILKTFQCTGGKGAGQTGNL
jgi:hypothetical protein